ncbi:hypothetical protein RGCCGE502_32861 (plasmid) [Rhizobium grahamii CCGE 502]|uniref:Uncharacterized protein n=2 Tax=Rhizobium grahamii TaxID=1120045 RepID=S3H4K7_9HYPH|nr:hypothetical protein RGCCGE502_32861 [Rhizobium grahamii CCGE 502]
MARALSDDLRSRVWLLPKMGCRRALRRSDAGSGFVGDAWIANARHDNQFSAAKARLNWMRFRKFHREFDFD